MDVLPIVFSVFIILIVLIALFLLNKKKLSRSDVLLVGLCDSGKTLLYTLLMNGSDCETFTSVKENIGDLVTTKGTIRVVDLPGHERLRLKFLDQFKHSTKAVGFVIDSVLVQKEIRDVADYLYTLLSEKSLSTTPVLIICNKQDNSMAKGSSAIEVLLEKEINLIRKTRASQLESIDKSSANMIFLGKTDKNFEFSQLKQKINFVECSAKKLQFQGLEDWLKSI